MDNKTQKIRNKSQDSTIQALTKDERIYLLDQFRSFDRNQPTLHHNMEVNWLGKFWICTTTGSSLILLTDLRDINVNREDNTPNVRAVLPDEVTEHLLDLEYLNSLWGQVPMITRPVRHECDACNGEGKFDHHGESYDCKSCNEKGYTESSTTQTIPEPDYFLEIDGRHVSIERWEELRRVIQLVKPAQVTLLRNLEKPALTIIRLREEIIVCFAKKYQDTYPKCVHYDMKRKEVTNV